jgi:hypothetical protein
MKFLFLFLIIIVILVVFLIIIFLKIIQVNNTILNKICAKDPEYFIYSSSLPGPTILIIGATHGNEPGSYYAIKNYMNLLNKQEIVLNSGKIIFIPLVNYCGFNLNKRRNPVLGDINRLYGKNSSSINDLIIKFIKESDFIIDFHESDKFNKIFKNKRGATINPTNTNLSINVAKFIISILNKTIDTDYKKFSVMNTSLNKYSLRQYILEYNLYNQCVLSNKNYILVEIVGKNNIQPLTLRINQGLIVISSVLSYFNMITNKCIESWESLPQSNVFFNFNL